MTYDHWKTTETDDMAEKLDQDADERELLYASIRRLRASHDRLLAAAKQAFCMIDRKYEGTPPYDAVISAIAAAEELAP